MNIKKLIHIEGLAQNFLKAPRVVENGSVLYVLYDFEMDTGEYTEKSISFEGVKGYRHTEESRVSPEMIETYNSIAEVVNSEWITYEMVSQGCKHYLIYFDDYGAYEVIAKSFRI